MACRWARVRPHRLSFLLGGDDPENRIVEEIPAAGYGGRRHAVHVLCLEVARQHYAGSFAGRWIVTAGLGGMGGARRWQP